jgi:hypothetical protein
MAACYEEWGAVHHAFPNSALCAICPCLCHMPMLRKSAATLMVPLCNACVTHPMPQVCLCLCWLAPQS